MIAVSSKLPSVTSGNAHRSDSATAATATGTHSGAKAGRFSSLMDDYLGGDRSDSQAAPDRRPAHEDKRDRDNQAAPVTVPNLEVKAILPILDWGLPSREATDAQAGAAATAVSLNGSSAHSALDDAMPEEPVIPKPQGNATAADGTSDLAFAARMFQSDPQPASPNAPAAVAPDTVPSAAATQASASLKASPESLTDTAADAPTLAPAITVETTNESQIAVAAAKAALLSTEERRNPGTHTGPSDANNATADAQPGATDQSNRTASAAETRETAAVRPVEPETPPTAPVSHDVSLRLADGPNNVDIRMSERGGEIRVMVHTPDGNLANSMRSELPDLVGKLRQNGYQAETWRPAAPPQTDGERRNGSDSHPQQDSAGARKDSRQQQQQQQQQNQPRWVGEWNTTLDRGQEPLI